jgi:hypothetical protein
MEIPMLFPFIQSPTLESEEKFGCVKSMVNVDPLWVNPLSLPLSIGPVGFVALVSSILSELQASRKLNPKKAKATVGQTSFKNDLLSFILFSLNIQKLRLDVPNPQVVFLENCKILDNLHR